MALIVGLLILLTAAAGIFLIIRHFVNKLPNEVLCIRGSANLEQAAGNQTAGAACYLQIKDQRFPGDSSLPDVIIPGADYIVYYLPDSSRIVSAELI